MVQKVKVTSTYCRTCGRDTPHEVRGCAGASVQICRRCLERIMAHLSAPRPARRSQAGR